MRLLGHGTGPGLADRLGECRVESRPAIPALTGLRFIAALTVVISHSVTLLLLFPAGAMPRWQSYLLEIGGIGMPLFFVLSGFVIHYNYSTPILRDGA